MSFIDIWSSLSSSDKELLLNSIKYSNLNRMFKTHGERLGFSSKSSFRDFAKWVKKNLKAAKNNPMDISDEDTEEEPPDLNVGEWEHNKSYWFDDKRDIYVVHLKSRKKPFVIPGERWRIIRDCYSNWDGEGVSVNEIARKQGLSRRTVIELLRIMGTTHGSSPWSDEELKKTDENYLEEDLLRKKEERILIKTQRIEWNRIKRDAERYRRLDLFASTISEKFKRTKD